MVIISECLLGVPCRYDGSARPSKQAVDIFMNTDAVFACPEKMGGLLPPRLPAEIRGGDGDDVLRGAARVYNKGNVDITGALIKGAENFLKTAEKCGARFAVLKGKSPSCGVRKIYDGTFTGTLKPGRGVTCALLEKNGIRVLEIE